MECLTPNKGHTLPDGTKVFGPSREHHEFDIPCGYCDTCRTNKAKLRGFKSFSNTLAIEDNMFLNITYGKYCPITPNWLYTLDKYAMPYFNKRLREHISKTSPGRKIGNIYCGEYGEKEERPHYHQITFNYKFPDMYPWRISKTGHQLFRSQIAEKLWSHGHVEIGTVTPESCTYVASYIQNKVYGLDKIKHYGDRVPEYVVTPKKNYVTGREYIRQNIDSIADFGCFKTIEGYSIGIDTHTLQWIEKTFPEHAKKIRIAKENFEIQKMTPEQKLTWKIIQDSKQQLQER